MNIESLHRIFLKHPKVCTDTRTLEKGCMFFALKGANFDGNKYASSALEAGAAFVVVDNTELALDDRYIVVDDVLQSLQQLANYHRRQLAIPILAITGTNGKTTTKELIAQVLSCEFKLGYTKGNFNNHIGVPLTLLSFGDDTELGVVEMGANHLGEIEELCNIAAPDFGIITNVGKAHLEGFGSFEGVVQTKTELYRYLQANNGKCFVCADNEILMDKSATLSRCTYGVAETANLVGEIPTKSYNLTVRARFPKGWLYLKSNLIGTYNFENIMAAACIGWHFEIDPLLIQQAIASYQPSNNRSQLEERGTNKVILDAYNANPTSMRGAVENLLAMDHPKKIAILGDMLELGKYSNDEHQAIVDLTESAGNLTTYLVGHCFMDTQHDDSSRVFEDVYQLKDYLSNNEHFDECLILIKGSRGIKLEEVLDNI